MKQLFATAALVCAMSVGAANANTLSSAQAAQLRASMAAYQLADIKASIADVINWKVGDYQKIKISLIFGSGTGDKEATKDEPDQHAVWLTENMSILGQNQKSEALISRVDGSLLKLIVNGKEQASTDQQIEILEQSETSVTVAAGTFDCMYVKANVTSGGQSQQVEIWANPVDTNLDGALKTVAQTQIGALTIEMTEFGNH